MTIDNLVWYAPQVFLVLLGIVGVVCLGLIVRAVKRPRRYKV